MLRKKIPVPALIACLCLCGVYAFSQQVTPQVIASAGDSDSLDSIFVDWTIGEGIILTHENNNVLLTQGFHQPFLIITSVDPLPVEYGTISVFPNPASEAMTMQLALDKQRDVRIALFDMSGKEMWKKNIEASDWNESLNISTFAAGAYTLRFIIDQTFTHSLKIQKLP